MVLKLKMLSFLFFSDFGEFGVLVWGFFLGGGGRYWGDCSCFVLFLKGKKPLASRCWCCCCEVLHQPNELALTVWDSKVSRCR